MFACGDVSVDVDSTQGTIDKAVYLCKDKTLTWNANNHKFQVKFRKKSPFADGQKTFDNNNNVSKGYVGDKKLTVYEYDITVDGQPVDDPQVVGGGGHDVDSGKN
jgi:hypothetical protein